LTLPCGRWSLQQPDAAGNLTWCASGLTFTGINCYQSSVPANKKVNHTYDPRNRVKDTTYGDGSPSITRTYTPDGLPEQVLSGLNTWNYKYNNRRSLTKECLTWWSGAAPCVGWNFDWVYNNYGYRDTLIDAWGAMAYAPNALGQPTQVSGYASLVTYHPNGSIASYRLDNGITHSTSLNARQLPNLMLDSGVTRDRYYYDDNGNVSYITDEQEGISTRSLAYDGLDRLVTANSNTWGAGSFSYDALDNIRTSNVGSRSLNHNIDSATNRLTSLSGSQAVGFIYDANGNITQRAGQQFIFDIGNRMSSAPGKATYSYDGHGRRTQANMADGVWRLWAYTSDGKLRLDHRSGKGATRYVYLGSKLIAESANYEVPLDPGSLLYGTTFLHTDALGSPVAKTNIAGQLLTPVRTSYEPYGATWSGPNPTKLGYTGHVNDVDTGLVQMQQRYYDPIAGRFLSVDPVVTDANTGSSFGRYHYAENNPFRFTDPTGMESTESQVASSPPPTPPPCNAACMRLRAISDAHSLGQSTTAAIGQFRIAGARRGDNLFGGKTDPGPSFQIFIDAANTAYASNPASIATMVVPPLGWLRGIRIHAEFAAIVERAGPKFQAEVSYKNGVPVPYGTPGSVRADGIYGPVASPLYAVELKSGLAVPTPQEIAAYRAHLPPGTALFGIVEMLGK
jgi:RHS repeat-associated protein